MPLSTRSIISVHNSVIVFTQSEVFQFQLNLEKKISIESEPVTAVMNFSDNCNRILCACKNKLYWMHVKEDSIKITPAANLPIKAEVSQLINLGSGSSVIVLCSTIEGEALVIMINLKSLTVGEIVFNI